jgi:hypothetical protein
MPRDLFNIILSDDTPVSIEVYAFLATAMAEEKPEGWN